MWFKLLTVIIGLDQWTNFEMIYLYKVYVGVLSVEGLQRRLSISGFVVNLFLTSLNTTYSDRLGKII